MTDQEASDAELYMAWCAGDQVAGRKLVRRHLAGLYRFFQCKVHDRVAAEDLVQLTLERLLVNLRELSNPNRFAAYLFGIAWNVLQGHYRKHYRERLLYVDDERLDLALTTPEQLGICVFPEHSASLLVRALHRLPIESQQILMLYYKESMKYDEIAEMFGVPCGTVASRLSTARKQLERVMRSLEQADESSSSTRRSFSGWAGEIRAGIRRPPLDGLLPHKLGSGWRLVRCTIASDAVQVRYRRHFRRPIVELEVRRVPAEPSRQGCDVVSIRDREWIRHHDRARQEYALRHLAGGREFKLAHRPATTWEWLVEVAGKLDLDQLTTARF
ncbi:RNA polymerase sigma factor [Nannocystaceae bacterium ST9]